MKRLILLRHAKAVPASPDLDDRDRRLADRGRSDAIRMGQFLKEEALLPELVLCSPAQRTRETLDLVLPQLFVTPIVRHLPELYLARWLTIVNLVRQVRDKADTLLLIGHNPGLEEAVKKLARPPGDTKTRKLHQLLGAEYPTAAVAILEFDVEMWSAVERGDGELLNFVRPRDLRGPD
ncbi:histidine phosphatase family protein [Rhizomicrobium electricum]|uniref:Histidine phosphatase family protein n=1 Tax=Rhizomicrobium electricum TaxID=480070 RepID=A0ABP3PQR4_9PROT|nr:phosphohistidine phosphatase [Rhizomicrobium electricum]